ncbi:MAG: hypothetical protein LAT67_01785 [Balneolales bacterium]|nr:hypothetical protein [Balneolales bacterium]
MIKSAVRLFITFVLLLFASGTFVFAQQSGSSSPDERARSKEKVVIPGDGEAGLLGIQDRGFTTHNRSNIGMFIENRGKLYARSNAIGVSGEYPINSEQEYIFQLNPVVLIPGNVIQGRNTSNEEWEAEFGFNNPESVRVATSTDPTTWPSRGWPVQDADGNPIIISDQDTYAAYNDSLNREEILNISIYQTGYSFAFPLIRDAVIFTFDVVNHSQNTYEDMYFGMYSDFDIGNRPGTDYAGYLNDRMKLDEDLDFFYYFDNGFSPDWGGPTGHFGLSWVSTPEINGEQLGMTDLHYNLWQDTPLLDEDPNWFYGVYTSNYDMVPEELWPSFFHPVEPGRRIDDLSTIPATGIDLVNNSASGPYTFAPGDTLSFVIAVVAGPDYPGIRETVENIHQAYQNNWVLPSAPPRPELRAYATNDAITLAWDNRSETEPDPFTGEFDFQGYRLYRSIDNGRSWDQIDRNRNPNVGADPVPIAVFDKDEDGIQYSFTDDTVREGFTYWYSLTAYDSGLPGIGSLESPIGNSEDEINIAVVTPQGNATNWMSSQVRLADHARGISTDSVFLRVLNPLDTDFGEYEVRFSRMARPVTNILTTVTSEAIDASKTPATSFTVTWSEPDVFSVRNDAAGRNRIRNEAYIPGQRYEIEEDFIAFTFFEGSEDADLRPQAGDELRIVPSVEVISLITGDAVLPKRFYQRDTEFITTDGVAVKLKHNPFSIERSSSRISVNIEQANFDALIAETYSGRITGTQADSIQVQITRQSNGSQTNHTIVNGGEISLARFSFSLTLNLDGITAGDLVNSTFAITTSMVRFPTEFDIYRYEKDSGFITTQPEDDVLSRIHVVPNPYLVANAWEPDISLQRREPERVLRFRNLPAECTIHIFTLVGERVKSIHKNDSSDTIGWDLRTESGREIAPGIYIYMVKSDLGDFISRFAVIK